MTKKAYYFEMSVSLASAIEYLEDHIPCFVEVEPVEMNWALVTITCRDEDVVAVEKALAPLVQGQEKIKKISKKY